jgi:hypothetical protein
LWQARLAAVATAAAVLPALCMPVAESVDRPEQPYRTMQQVEADMKQHHSRWHYRLWSQAAVLYSSCVPTNSYIVKSIFSKMVGPFTVSRTEKVRDGRRNIN